MYEHFDHARHRARPESDQPTYEYPYPYQKPAYPYAQNEGVSQRQFSPWGPLIGGLIGGMFGPSGPPPGPPPGPGPGQTPGFTPAPGAPTAPPPGFTPPRPPGSQEVTTLAVDPGGIRRCLYRYTYIWLTNRQQFWFYPVFVGRNSVAGYRWTGFFWTYVGLDLRLINAFQCY